MYIHKLQLNVPFTVDPAALPMGKGTDQLQLLALVLAVSVSVSVSSSLLGSATKISHRLAPVSSEFEPEFVIADALEAVVGATAVTATTHGALACSVSSSDSATDPLLDQKTACTDDGDWTEDCDGMLTLVTAAVREIFASVRGPAAADATTTE